MILPYTRDGIPRVPVAIRLFDGDDSGSVCIEGLEVNGIGILKGQ